MMLRIPRTLSLVAALSCSACSSAMTEPTHDGSVSHDGSAARDSGSSTGDRDSGNASTNGGDAASSSARDSGSRPRSDAAIARGEPVWIGVGAFGYLAVSTDRGLTWTETNREEAQGDDHTPWLFRDVVYTNGQFMVVKSDFAARIMTSRDGVNWNEDAYPFSAGGSWLDGMAYIDGTWIGTGGCGSVRSDDDGETWRDNDWVNCNMRDLAAGDGVWVSVGNPGEPGPIMVSTDTGAIWNPVAALTGGDSVPDLVSVAFGNGVFVATDYEVCVFSTDGAQSWSRCPVSGAGFGVPSFSGGRLILPTGDGYVELTPEVANSENWPKTMSEEFPTEVVFADDYWVGWRLGVGVYRGTSLDQLELVPDSPTDFRGFTGGVIVE